MKMIFFVTISTVLLFLSNSLVFSDDMFVFGWYIGEENFSEIIQFEEYNTSKTSRGNYVHIPLTNITDSNCTTSFSVEKIEKVLRFDIYKTYLIYGTTPICGFNKFWTCPPKVHSCCVSKCPCINCEFITLKDSIDLETLN